MKRKLTLSLAIIFVLLAMLPCSVLANGITPYYNNTSDTTTAFDITDAGQAIVYVDYTGYSGVTTSATIEIKIEKRTLLFFWNDVITETLSVDGYRYDNELYYQLSDTGTYRCTVEYTIYGTGGSADVVTFEDTVKY